MSAKEILAEIHTLSVMLSKTKTPKARLFLAKRIQKRQAHLKKVLKNEQEQ